MNPAEFSRRLVKRIYGATRIAVWIITVLAVLLVGLFLYLRSYGVPQPLLKEVLRRVNASGIPIDIEDMTLTFHGWRADSVRYYSENPDDLAPLFRAEHVFFSVRNSKQRRAGSDALSLDIRAVEIELSPSVEWGIEIPADSPSRHVEEMKVSLGFFPDRIRVLDGEMHWLGTTFLVDGTVLKRDEPVAWWRTRRQKTLLPTPVSAAQFQTIEDQVRLLTLPDGAVVDLDFTVDTAHYEASRITLAIHAENVGYRDGGFSRVELAGTYAYPCIELERAALFDGKQSIQLDGEYNLAERLAEGSLFNSIVSNQALGVLPARLRDWLNRTEIQIQHLPRLALDFGPAAPEELLNHLSGVFSIRGLGYRGMEIEALRGEVKRRNNRLECTHLQGSIPGREAEAESLGSAMAGGRAAGEVFWDGNTREFGVVADAGFDPNLLIPALSFSRIATNIIGRFSFGSSPPEGHVELGANVDDWETFYINIRATGHDVVFQGVEFSSVNVVQTYRDMRLNLDPVAGIQGGDFVRGSAAINLEDETVMFDGVARLNPAALEDMIYPEFNFFGNHISTEGTARITARGTFDWGRMRKTDFTAAVETDHLEIPIAQLDHFRAEVIGAGTNITVRNAQFGLYGGEGNAEFSLNWDPRRKELPYATTCSFSGVDFRRCIGFVNGGRPVRVAGSMAGNARIEADLSTNFYTTANGQGYLHVEKGQLADLPLFQGFSRLMRKVFPSFKVFSITRLRGHFAITDGVISSEDAFFGGDVVSAKARGRYTHPTGYDASVQVQVMNEGHISKVVQAITNPLMKLLEMKLQGTLAEPSWKLEKF